MASEELKEGARVNSWFQNGFHAHFKRYFDHKRLISLFIKINDQDVGLLCWLHSALELTAAGDAALDRIEVT